MTTANFKRYYLPLSGDTQDDAWVAPRSGTPRHAWFCDAEADLPTGADASDVVTGDWAFALSEGTFWKRGASSWTQVQSGSGAPTDADYLIGTSNAGLSAEIVVGTTPGGELGGTWASPTVDATHAGSTHTADTKTISVTIDGAGATIRTGVYIAWRVPYTVTVTAVRGYVDTGTTTVVNAQLVGTGDFCSSDITINPSDAWEDGTANQNLTLAAGDTVGVEVVTAGTATQCTIQVDVARA